MESKQEEQELKKEALEEVEAKKAETEILSGEREVDIDGLGKVIIFHPTLSVNQECEKIYSEKFIEYLNENKLPTINQLEKLLEERGIWGPDQDADLEQKSQNLISLTVQLNQSKQDLKTVTEKSRKKLEDKIAKLARDRMVAETELISKTMYRGSLIEATVERRAEKDALFHKMLKCTKTTEGNPLFKKKEDLFERSYGTGGVERLAVACLNFWSGLSDPLLEEQLEEMIGS
jgi:hypothetical protein